MSKIEKYLNEGFEFVPAVVCFLVRDDEVLLGLRKKVSHKLGYKQFAGVGGKRGDSLEYENETDAEAMLREVEEEIGVVVTNFEEMGLVRFINPFNTHWSQSVRIYIVRGWRGNPQETDVIKPVWFKQSELPLKQMWKDNRMWLPLVLSGTQVDCVFLFDEIGEIEEFVLK